MKNVQITSEMNTEVITLQAQGKTPWVVLMGDTVLTVCDSRSEARTLNTKLKGKIGKASEFSLIVESDAPVAPLKSRMFHPAHPLAQIQPGLATETSEQAAGIPETKLGDVLANAAETTEPVPAPKAKAPKIPLTRESVIDRPCKQVWHIADEMMTAAGGLDKMRRKDVLARCVASGIAYYTARTQYQLWLTIQNGGSI